jgi:hypothetical protein
VLGWIPGFICEACLAVGAIVGGVSALIYLIEGETAEAVKVAVETVAGFVMGRGATKAVEATLASMGKKMVYQARHYDKAVRAALRKVPTSLRVKVERVWTAAIGAAATLMHEATGGYGRPSDE